MMRRLKRVWTHLKRKRGAITFPVILGAGAMFLGGLFFMADMPLKLILSNEMVDTTHNAAASAITQIVEEEVKYGRLIVDDDRARQAAYEVFARTYNLDITPNGLKRKGDSDESSSNKNVLSKDPHVDVIVINKPLHGGNGWAQEVELPNEEKTKIVVRETSVIVYVDMEFNTLIRRYDDGMKLTRFAVSEVSFPDYLKTNN